MGSTDRKTAPERSGVEQNVTCPAAKYVAGLRSTAAGPVIESLGRSARGFQHPCFVGGIDGSIILIVLLHVLEEIRVIIDGIVATVTTVTLFGAV